MKAAKTNLRSEPTIETDHISSREEWKKGMKVLPRYVLGAVRKILLRPARCSISQFLSLINISKARLQLTIGVRPLSQVRGRDRGMQIGRYYLGQFLQEFSSDIRGHCLEFDDPRYIRRFGSSTVTKADILHIDDSNPLATLVADLTKPNDITSNCFDCIICTQVLHLIFELDKAISELYRILKPGGVLLVAVPHVSMCNPKDHEVWRFTPEGLHRVLAKVFGTENVTVRAYGNSLTAAGQIRGLAAQEFTKAELDYQDLRFAVVICARAIKQT